MHAPEASMEYNLLETGDHIGTESYVDLRTDLDDLSLDGSSGVNQDGRRRVKREKEVKKYPPVMPSLERAELSVLKRYYTDDGRLVIKEEKAINQKFVRSVTADGRLRLFPLHQVIVDSREIAGPSEAKDDTPSGDNVHPQSDNDDRRGGGEDRETGSETTPTVATGGGEDRETGSETTPAVSTGGGGGGGGGRRMCYKYDSLESSASCTFAMPLLASRRPVQI